MSAIPLIFFDSGFVDNQPGALLNPPAEMFTAVQMAFYASCPRGWSICPLGYSVFSDFDGLGRKVVVPAIYPPEGPVPRRKFGNYPLKFSKKQVEEFAASHLSVSEVIRKQRDVEFKNLTHDLRGISTEIYHTALNLKSELEAGRYKFCMDKASAVLDAQQMMSLRLDIVDYESGSSSDRPKETIVPYRIVDKVVKSFRNRSFASGISIHLEGSLKSKIYGPPIFEIVPFVIIENAFKYAPVKSKIAVKLEENFRDNEIVMRIESFGPKIRDNEKKKIFERNYRGIGAGENFKSGSGIGLFAAKTIVETHFGGAIFVNQFHENLIHDDAEYFYTRFTITLPAAEQKQERAGRRRPSLKRG
ncbi:MAG: hypothetical protein Pars2KO_01510 [Parasphingorhabdus sp.]